MFDLFLVEIPHYIENPHASLIDCLWSDKHSETFVAEMYLHEPWKYKKGSKERGNVWDMISESLNSNL